MFGYLGDSDKANRMTTSELLALADILDVQNKKKPNWYGIHGIKFIYHNNTADPEILYKGKLINAMVVEDTMWDRFKEEYDSADGDHFPDFMLSHADDVKELCATFLNE